MLLGSNRILVSTFTLFSRKKKTQSHPNISHNNIQVERVSHQKHLDIIFDEKLNFKEYIDSTILKVNRDIAVLKKLRYNLPRKSQITIYKVLFRPRLDLEISSTTNLIMNLLVKNVSLYNAKLH